MSLAAKLAEVTAEIGYVPKNGFNKSQGYRYVTESDLADAIREKLSKRGVFLTTSVLTFETSQVQGKNSAGLMAHVRTKHTFTDGEESISFYMAGSGVDYPGDKAIYKAITGAVKYALMKVFLVPTGDDPEADGKASPGGEDGSGKTATARESRPAPADEAKGGASPAEVHGEGTDGEIAPPDAASQAPATKVQLARLKHLYGGEEKALAAAKTTFGLTKLEDLTKDEAGQLVDAKAGVNA